MARVETLLGHSPNTLQWNLAGLGGEPFEDAVVGAIQAYFAEHYPTATCRPTSRRADGGRDLEIEAREPVSICGVTIHPRQDGRLRAAVEVKSKTQSLRSRLDEKSFARSPQQLGKGEFNYFILVTNVTLTPRTVCQTADLLEARGIEFLVIDEARLFTFLASTTQGKRLIAATERPTEEEHSEFVVEAQVQRSTLNDEFNLVIYLWLRNYTAGLLPIEMILRADAGWHSNLPSYRSSIDPNRDLTLKLLAKGSEVEDSEVVLAFRVADAPEKLARIAAADPELDFTPPLHGEQHLSLVAEISDTIQKDLPFSLISIAGEAGTGKSRIVSEANIATANQTRKVYRALIDRSHPAQSVRDLCQRVQRGLGNPDWRSADTESAGAALRRLVYELEHPIFSVVIVLEDLHHSSDDVISTLKELITYERSEDRAPLTLIVTGRDDFTFPNQAYFTLLDLLATKLASEHIKVAKLYPLTRPAARSLVRNIIDDVPSDVISRILDISESVPFCLIQIIEHLLEAGIAKLRRRNRAGIPNPFSYAHRTPLPDSMSEICFRQKSRRI